MKGLDGYILERGIDDGYGRQERRLRSEKRKPISEY
jgi:hypothetical protein